MPGIERTKGQRFCDCGVSERLFYTVFLLLMGVGYLMALTYLYTSHAGHDGKPGLSLEDIAETYYGNRSGSRLEAAIRGSMAAYIQLEDRHVMVEWLKSGAPEADYLLRIYPILGKSCLNCHTTASGLDIPDFSTYAGLRKVAAMDAGESVHTLMKLSHIHLFGIGLVLLGVGMIFRRADLPEWLKGALLVLPFLAIASDIAAWFLTHWDPNYALVVVIAGAVLGLCLAAQILISLHQLWIGKTTEMGSSIMPERDA